MKRTIFLVSTMQAVGKTSHLHGKTSAEWTGSQSVHAGSLIKIRFEAKLI